MEPKLHILLNEHGVALHRVHLFHAFLDILVSCLKAFEVALELLHAAEASVVLHHALVKDLDSKLDHPGCTNGPVWRLLTRREIEPVIEVHLEPIVNIIKRFNLFELFFPKVILEHLVVLVTRDHEVFALTQARPVHRARL